MPITLIRSIIQSIKPEHQKEWLALMALLALLPGLQDYSIFLIDFGYPPGGSALYRFVIGGAFIALPVTYLLCQIRQDYIPLLATTPLALLLATWILPIPFLLSLFHVSCVLAYAWFIWRGGMRTRVFAVFLVLVFLALSSLHLLLFVGVSLLLRSLLQLLRQNWQTFQRLGWGKTIKSIALSILLWSPMLLVVIPSYWLNKQLEEKAAQGIYATTFLNSHTAPRIFEVDLDVSLDSLMLRSKIRAANKIDSLREVSADLAATAPKAVGDLIRNSIVPPKPKKIDLDCSWYRLDCHAAQAAATAAATATSDAFKATAIKLAGNTERKLNTFFTDGDGKANLLLTDVDELISQEIENTREQTEKSVLNGYRLLKLILFLLELGFFFVVFKSFTYVLARVVFSQQQKNTFISLLPTAATVPHGNVKVMGGNYHIEAGASKNYLVNRHFEPSGRAPKITIPQPTTALIARLFNGCYAMNKIKMGEGRTDVEFNAAIGIEFVEWNLAEGESVVFRLADFVGITEDVKLKRIYSLRMESLLLGHIFFTTATGPGKLILRSKGNVMITGGKEEPSLARSIPQHRMIAWQQTSRFHVESELNIADVFFSGVYLQPFSEDITVINSDQTGKAKSGISRFFWHFLLPN